MEKGPWDYFDAKFAGKDIQEVISYLETYPTFVLVDPPTEAALNTANHQDEAVHLYSSTGEEFVFLEEGFYRYRNNNLKILIGECFLEDEYDLPHEKGCLLITQPEGGIRQAKFYRLGRFFGDTTGL